MRSIHTIGTCLTALVLAVPAHAQERPILELSLADAVERAMESNLDIEVERFNPEEDATEEDGPGYILEVDLEYPDRLHLPFPESCSGLQE